MPDPFRASSIFPEGTATASAVRFVTLLEGEVFRPLLFSPSFYLFLLLSLQLASDCERTISMMEQPIDGGAIEGGM